MVQRNLWERVLASLHDAALNDSLWPSASALIDDACGLTGSGIVVGDGIGDKTRILFAGTYSRGQ